MCPIRVCAIILLSLHVVGCVTPYKLPVVEPADSEFDGFLTYPKSRLVMIHGMCHHDRVWVEKTLTRLQVIYGLVGPIPIAPTWRSEENGVELYESALSGHGRTVSFYGIVYSKLTLPLKRQYLCPDVSRPTDSCPEETIEYRRTRARLNAALKNTLLNDCISDAVIYLGKTGQKIREGVWQAFEQIAEKSSVSTNELQSPLFFVSESLGSKVLSDALACNTKKESKSVEMTLASATHLFFGANQIPLLNTGFTPASCYETLPAKRLLRDKVKADEISTLNILIEKINGQKRKLAPMARSASPSRQAIKLIAYTDPNDLLSYEVRQQDVQVADPINVIVSNAPSWFNVLESPIKAHMGYMGNKSVVEYIACGKNRNSIHPRQISDCVSVNK